MKFKSPLLGVIPEIEIEPPEPAKQPDFPSGSPERSPPETRRVTGQSFSPSWIINRIVDILWFARLSGPDGIDPKRRRRIARLAGDLRGASARRIDGEFNATLSTLAKANVWRARELSQELIGLGGLRGGFHDTLSNLAGENLHGHNQVGGGPTWRSSIVRGGDRRSGERRLEASVLGMAVRLYCEAHVDAGFSVKGPLVRFANEIGVRRLVDHSHGRPCAQNIDARDRRYGGLRASARFISSINFDLASLQRNSPGLSGKPS